MYWAEDRIGKERLHHAYAYKKLLDKAGLVALGTDFPIEKVNPLLTFYAAIARKDASGYPKKGFQPENALSRKEALRGMTIWAAYANFEEDEKGSIETGKFADFTVLDRDILQIPEKDILKAKVKATFINGEEVYTDNPSKIRASAIAEELKSLLAPLFQKHMDDIIEGDFSKVMMTDWANNDTNLLEWRNETAKKTTPVR